MTRDVRELAWILCSITGVVGLSIFCATAFGPCLVAEPERVQATPIRPAGPQVSELRAASADPVRAPCARGIAERAAAAPQGHRPPPPHPPPHAVSNHPVPPPPPHHPPPGVHGDHPVPPPSPHHPDLEPAAEGERPPPVRYGIDW